MQATQSKTRPRSRPGQGFQPEPLPGRRRDPRSRRHTEGANWANLSNGSPKKKYVLVSQNDKEQGVDYYTHLGYVPEEWEKGGVSFARGRTGVDGEEMTFRGHLLMSISLRDSEDIEDFGPEGDTGQQLADEVEERIIDRQGGEDHIRGLLGRRLMRAQNMTRDNEVEG